MEQETMGQLIQMFAQLGGDAKQAFIFYLVAKYVLQYVTFMFFFVVVYLVIVRVILSVRINTKESQITSEVAAKAEVRPHAYYSESDFTQMRTWIQKQK